MTNCTKNKFKLSSNVLEEIHKYADQGGEQACPTLFLQVKEVERDKGRYWLILVEESGKEIWAMFSVLLTQQILIQQLVVKPIIKLKHYYLHKFDATYFMNNPLEAYINVIGINDIEIFNGKVFKKPLKEMTLKSNGKKLQMPPRRKRRKKQPEPELESTDESDDNFKSENEEKIIKKKSQPKTNLNNAVTMKEVVQPLENKSQNINQELTDEINDISKPRNIVRSSENKSSDEKNDKLKTKSTVQPLEDKSSNVRNDTSQVENIMQPSENKSPNIQTTNIVPETFVGNGKTATLISSLTLTNNSPLIRGCVVMCGSINLSARGCGYRRCRIKDSSGEISCVMFEPICTAINNFLKVGAIIEVENAVVDQLLATMLAGSEKYKLNFRPYSKVALYRDNICVYEHPPKTNPLIQSSINNRKVQYKRLQNIRSCIRSVDRVDVIGVLVWMSPLLEVNSSNKRVKCRNIRILDESGSALISLWENTAESLNFPIGSIISAKCARLKMVRDDIELVIDFKARISLAEDCEEKTRLQKWYQPAAKRMIPKI